MQSFEKKKRTIGLSCFFMYLMSHQLAFNVNLVLHTH